MALARGRGRQLLSSSSTALTEGCIARQRADTSALCRLLVQEARFLGWGACSYLHPATLRLPSQGALLRPQTAPASPPGRLPAAAGSTFAVAPRGRVSLLGAPSGSTVALPGASASLGQQGPASVLLNREGFTLMRLQAGPAITAGKLALNLRQVGPAARAMQRQQGARVAAAAAWPARREGSGPAAGWLAG